MAYGVYSWAAGATVAQVVGDFEKICSGGTVAQLSAGCVKSATAIGGTAADWVAVDPGYGVLKRACLDGLGEKCVRLVQSGSMLYLIALESWAAVTHVGSKTTAPEAGVYGNLSISGSFVFSVTDEAIWIASSDYLTWACAAEFARESKLMEGGRSNLAVFGRMNSANYPPRFTSLKAVGAVGEVLNVQGGTLPGALGQSSLRDSTERQFIQMVRATAMHSSDSGYVLGKYAGVYCTGETRTGGDEVVGDDGAVYVYLPSYSVTRHFLVKQK